MRSTSWIDDLNLFRRARDPETYCRDVQARADAVSAEFERLGLAVSPKSTAILINGSKKPFRYALPQQAIRCGGGGIPILRTRSIRVLRRAHDDRHMAVGSAAYDAAVTVRHLGVFIDPRLTGRPHACIKLRADLPNQRSKKEKTTSSHLRARTMTTATTARTTPRAASWRRSRPAQPS